MKIIMGFFILLLFYFAGQCLSYLIGGFIPGNIIGMILLFLALHFKLLRPVRIHSISLNLCKNMAIFFIPAGVGLLQAVDIISQFWASILIICTVSTILVITVVGLIQQKMEGKKATR